MTGSEDFSKEQVLVIRFNKQEKDNLDDRGVEQSRREQGSYGGFRWDYAFRLGNQPKAQWRGENVVKGETGERDKQFLGGPGFQDRSSHQRHWDENYES